MYENNIALMKIKGNFIKVFDVLSGVLQGCPLSGSLFNFAIDPLLWVFSRMIVAPKLGKVLACADDIGAALTQLKTLKTMHSFFKMFTSVSRLVLKSRKCVIILTSVVCSEQNVAIIRGWLQENIPEWSDMRIEGSAKYLGVFLGPQVGKNQWTEPMLKFHDRVSSISKEELAARQSVLL